MAACGRIDIFLLEKFGRHEWVKKRMGGTTSEF